MDSTTTDSSRLASIYNELQKLHINEINKNNKDDCNGHFCTASLLDTSLDSIIKREKTNGILTPTTTTATIPTTRTNSLKICEQYKPSYTSKKDQLTVINDRISMLRQSKQIMKETMNDIDKVLDDKYKNEKANEFDLEEFFKSKRSLGSSLNVSSFKSSLPRKDIPAPKYINEVNKNYTKTEKVDMKSRATPPIVPVVPTSIFEPFNEFTFTDTSLLENRKKFLENRKKNQLNKRVLSAGFSLVKRGKADSDRTDYKINNKKVRKPNIVKSRINSAH